MAEITLRVPLGRPLTYQEVDDNFRSVQELTLLAQQFALTAQEASTLADEAKNEAIAAKDQAVTASGSAALDAQRAEDAADRAEAIADFDGLHNTLAGRDAPNAHDASAIGFKQEGEGAVERTLAQRAYDGAVELPEFFIIGESDWTHAFERAKATGRRVHIPAGEYIVSGIELHNGDYLYGDGTHNTILRLKDNANSHVLYGTDIEQVHLSGFSINANKGGQSSGSNNNWRGVYFLGSCQKIRVDNLLVENAVDHGFVISEGGDYTIEAGKDSLITNLKVRNCGSQEHLDNGGAGGSGITGGSTSTTWVGCWSSGNHLNGFKARGTLISCNSYENGGGYETGFVLEDKYKATTYIGCKAIGNSGDGWRNQGQGDDLTWIGCRAEYNGKSGIFFQNNVKRAIVNGCFLVNNGWRDGVPNDFDGYDGITFAATTQVTEDVVVSATHIYDDQSTPTQQYGISIHKEVRRVSISDDVVFGPAKNGPIRISSAATYSDVRVGNCYGLSGRVDSLNVVTNTGSTTTEPLKNTLIRGLSYPASSTFEVIGRGEISGKDGTKKVRFFCGSQSAVVVNALSEDEGAWICEATVTRHGARVIVSYAATLMGKPTLSGAFSFLASFANDLTFGFSSQNGSENDSVQLDVYKVSVR